jgi:hypothetical protein
MGELGERIATATAGDGQAPISRLDAGQQPPAATSCHRLVRKDTIGWHDVPGRCVNDGTQLAAFPPPGAARGCAGRGEVRVRATRAAVVGKPGKTAAAPAPMSFPSPTSTRAWPPRAQPTTSPSAPTSASSTHPTKDSTGVPSTTASPTHPPKEMTWRRRLPLWRRLQPRTLADEALCAIAASQTRHYCASHPRAGPTS